MFPARYQLVVAVSIMMGGVIARFFGYCFFRIVVAVMGFGVGALVAASVVANVLFSIGGRDPRVIVVIFLAIAGAVAATYLQRYFIIVFTAFGGAWTMIVGAMALVGNRTALKAATSGDVWVAYPMNPAPG